MCTSQDLVGTAPGLGGFQSRLEGLAVVSGYQENCGFLGTGGRLPQKVEPSERRRRLNGMTVTLSDFKEEFEK